MLQFLEKSIKVWSKSIYSCHPTSKQTIEVVSCYLPTVEIFGAVLPHLPSKLEGRMGMMELFL